MAEPLTLVVPPELDGERADKVVAVLGEMSRAEARRLCDSGRVQVEGEAVPARQRLAAGQRLVFPPAEPPPALVADPSVRFEVRHEDPHLLVVDKPAGVVVHPGAAARAGTLAAGLLARYPELEGVGVEGRWGIVHRLDRDTSGLLAVARTALAYRRLTADLAARRVHRQYLALVHGTFDLPTGTVDAPIGADPVHPPRRRVAADGRPARTHYVVEEAFPDADLTLLRVTLETGRTHQIRVHLASISHAVVADRMYGTLPDPVGVGRVWLHAVRLELEHPVSGEPVAVESPLPADLAASLQRLRGGSDPHTPNHPASR